MTQYMVIWVKSKDGVREDEIHEDVVTIYAQNREWIDGMTVEILRDKEAFDAARNAYKEHILEANAARITGRAKEEMHGR